LRAIRSFTLSIDRQADENMRDVGVGDAVVELVRLRVPISCTGAGTSPLLG
jgi:hypothetical protein